MKPINAFQKASGADGVTKEQYEDNLEGNIKDLLARMKRNAYKPQPVKRVYIPKPGTDKKRPLGLPAYEDKLVQASSHNSSPATFLIFQKI